MYNVPTPVAYVRYYQVSNLTIKNNICSVAEGYNKYSGYLVFLNVCVGNEVDVQNNVFYGLDNILNDSGAKRNWNFANSSSAWKPSPNNPPREPESPFESIDFDKCIFKQKAQYAEYGAQR